MAIIMKQKQQRMMAEATTKSSPITVLPEELMIEILSRVESSNPIQFRCVCKLWKSLVLTSKAVKDFRDSSEVFNLAVSQESEEDEEKLELELEQKEDEEEQWMKNGVDWLDKLYRNLKVRFETMRDDIQALEDRVKCLRSFMRIYLNSLNSSYSQL
ncbi:uncharacterized protein LOC123896315 [Trifolium pratense]|uniref:uncharacterized protein LOC123896315 n=1 Tax=Trifolium pratense TaxID=57577 RepID=UPI001E690EC2|nr:uncharacterized protein LOC123896315 [Trifolium pratense]